MEFLNGCLKLCQAIRNLHPAKKTYFMVLFLLLIPLSLIIIFSGAYETSDLPEKGRRTILYFSWLLTISPGLPAALACKYSADRSSSRDSGTVLTKSSFPD